MRPQTLYRFCVHVTSPEVRLTETPVQVTMRSCYGIFASFLASSLSGLGRQRPIWSAGEDRSEASRNQFYTWLGPPKATRISARGHGLGEVRATTAEHDVSALGSRSANFGTMAGQGWAHRFFEHWRAALKWQRLRLYQKFAAMIDRHGHGIAAYCRPENRVALGFVEGLNNTICVLQRLANGLRDEGYLSAPTRLHEEPQVCSTRHKNGGAHG
jgi:Transposase